MAAHAQAFVDHWSEPGVYHADGDGDEGTRGADAASPGAM